MVVQVYSLVLMGLAIVLITNEESVIQWKLRLMMRIMALY